MKIKKILTFGMAVAMTVGMLGCGSNQNSNQAAKGTNANDKASEHASLRFSWWGDDSRHKATLDMIKQYEKENPGVKIAGEYSGWDGYLEKMTTQVAAGTAPDIIQIDYAFLENLWKTDDFVDFNKEKDVDLSGFSKSLLKGVTSPDGKLIGIPCGVNFTGLFGNKKAADHYGVDLTQHFNWDRLLSEGKKVHAQDKEAYLLYPYAVNRYIFEPYLFNMTGKKLIDDNYKLGFTKDQIEKTLDFIEQLYKEGVMEPYDETVEIKAPAENPLWLNNKLVLCPEFGAGYDALAASLPKENLISLEPLGDSDADNSGIVLRPTNMIAVNAKSKHVKAAVKFVNSFFNDDKSIKTLGMTRSIPANKKAMDMMTSAGKLNPDLKKIDAFDEAHKGGLGQNIISTNAEIETIEGDTLSAVYYGDKSTKAAASDFMKLMADKVNDLKEDADK